MYIPYDKIGRTIALFFPKQSDKITRFFYYKKVDSNCKWIKKNRKRVLARLRKKAGTTPLKVVFYVYEQCRWKSQSIYDLMEKDAFFEPLIVVSKNISNETNFNYQTSEDVEKTYKFFKSKGMNVEYGYDITKK